MVSRIIVHILFYNVYCLILLNHYCRSYNVETGSRVVNGNQGYGKREYII